MEIAKSPQGDPPPLSPAVNHPPHAKMKHTEEADALVPEFAARWRARKRTSQQIIFDKIRGKGKQEKDDLLVYVPKRHPNTYPRKIIQNTLKIHRYLNNPTKRIFISMSCSRKDRMTGKQLYEASHLYLMIAMNTENVQNDHNSTSHS